MLRRADVDEVALVQPLGEASPHDLLRGAGREKIARALRRNHVRVARRSARLF